MWKDKKALQSKEEEICQQSTSYALSKEKEDEREFQALLCQNAKFANLHHFGYNQQPHHLSLHMTCMLELGAL